MGGANDWIAIHITKAVGTMWCAYVFAAIALISLPDAIKGGTGPLIAWLAQTFLQLILLPLIMVGQQIGSQVAEQRKEEDHQALLAVVRRLHIDVKAALDDPA